MREIDKTDRKILYYLDRDARMPLTVLAKKVGTSKEVAHYRLKRLVREKRISKFYTIINNGKFGYYLFKMYIQLQNTNKESEEKMIEYLYSHPRYAWSCFSSGKWDMLVAVWAKDPLDFEENFQMDFMGKLESTYSQRS